MIFSIFLMAIGHHLEFAQNRKILLTGGLEDRGTMPNFFKIGQCVAKILRFFDFSKRPLLPFCILEIKNIYYRATAMISAVYAVVVCLSVCLSVCLCVCVCHTPVLYQNVGSRKQRKQRRTIAP